MAIYEFNMPNQAKVYPFSYYSFRFKINLLRFLNICFYYFFH